MASLSRVVGTKANVGLFRTLSEEQEHDFIDFMHAASSHLVEGIGDGLSEDGARSISYCSSWGVYAAAKLCSTGMALDGKSTVGIYHFALLAANIALAGMASDPIESPIAVADRPVLKRWIEDMTGGQMAYSLVSAADAIDDDWRETILGDLKGALEGIVSERDELRDENESLKADIARLEAEVRKLSDGSREAELESEVSRLESEVEHLTGDVRRLEADRASLQSSVEDLKSSGSAERQVYVTHEITPLDGVGAVLLESGAVRPRSAQEAVDIAAEAFGDVMAFSGKALADVRSFSGDPAEMFEALSLIATEYAPSAAAGRPVESRAFTERHGMELSANESRMTKSSSDLMRQRTATFKLPDGTVMELTATHHLKGRNNSSERALRVYFLWSEELGKVAVVRCGGHLDTFGGKHKKGW